MKARPWQVRCYDRDGGCDTVKVPRGDIYEIVAVIRRGITAGRSVHVWPEFSYKQRIYVRNLLDGTWT